MGPDGVRVTVRVEARAGMKPHIWTCHVIWGLTVGFERVIGRIYAKITTEHFLYTYTVYVQKSTWLR